MQESVDVLEAEIEALVERKAEIDATRCFPVLFFFSASSRLD